MVRAPRRAETIRATIVPIGGEVKTVALKKDSTVREAVEAAGYSSDVEVMDSHGDKVELDAIIEDGDEITVLSSGKVEGGC